MDQNSLAGYKSGCSLKQFCIVWNLSTQLMPFGSSSEKTKQENASLNFSPHGPSAMPPRHGQSQLISPVSGLNADSPLRSSVSPSVLGCSGSSELGSEGSEGSEASVDLEAELSGLEGSRSEVGCPGQAGSLVGTAGSAVKEVG